MHNIRVFSQRSAWAPYMRLHELRSFTHLGVTGPQKWPLSLKKGKSGRQKIKSWYFYCPYVFLKCLQCTFWRNQTVSFSGLSSSLTEAIFRSHMRCATPYWTWRQSQRTEELKSRTRPRTTHFHLISNINIKTFDLWLSHQTENYFIAALSVKFHMSWEKQYLYF